MAASVDISRKGLRRQDLPELLEQVTIDSPSDIKRAAIALKSISDQYNLKAALCEDISSSAPMIDTDGTILNADVFGWVGENDRWWEENCLALSSPLIRACRYETEPFWCNAEGLYSRQKNPYLENLDLRPYFESKIFQKAAIVIPVHLPFGQISANSFQSKDEGVTDLSVPFEQYSNFLSLLVRRFISGYVMAMRKKRRIPSDCILSRREVECLRWAAIGKTDKEVGMIISLSHATVRYHVHRAGEKLNSVNRAQTIFKAGQLGYLGAND